MSFPGDSKHRRIKMVCWRTTDKASSSNRAWSSATGGGEAMMDGGDGEVGGDRPKSHTDQKKTMRTAWDGVGSNCLLVGWLAQSGEVLLLGWLRTTTSASSGRRISIHLTIFHRPSIDEMSA